MTQPEPEGRVHQSSRPTRDLDLRGLLCPLTWARTRYALESLAPGDELCILVDHRPAVPDIKRNAEDLGHEILSANEAPQLGKNVWELRLRRG
jgi:tRNA 2-thiouridine synthesizing protein A